SRFAATLALVSPPRSHQTSLRRVLLDHLHATSTSLLFSSPEGRSKGSDCVARRQRRRRPNVRATGGRTGDHRPGLVTPQERGEIVRNPCLRFDLPALGA